MLLRQQQDSKALSASKRSTTADRGEKNRRPRNRFKGNCLNCGRKSHRAEDCRSAKKMIEKPVDAAADKYGGGGGKCYVCGSEGHFAYIHWSLCRSLKHRTRDCEEQDPEKGAMLAKINVPAICEVGLRAATIGAARGDSKEEGDSDSEVAFYTSYTEAGIIAYKKAPSDTTVEAADGTILPIDGFGTVK